MATRWACRNPYLKPTTEGAPGSRWRKPPCPRRIPHTACIRTSRLRMRRRGMIVGGYVPPRSAGKSREERDEEGDLPDWMHPESTLHRRQQPRLTLEMDTRDGGATWKSGTAPLLGSLVSAASGWREGPAGLRLRRFLRVAGGSLPAGSEDGQERECIQAEGPAGDRCSDLFRRGGRARILGGSGTAGPAALGADSGQSADAFAARI